MGNRIQFPSLEHLKAMPFSRPEWLVHPTFISLISVSRSPGKLSLLGTWPILHPELILEGLAYSITIYVLTHSFSTLLKIFAK